MEGTWYAKKRVARGEDHRALSPSMDDNVRINSDDNVNADVGDVGGQPDNKSDATGRKFSIDYSKRGTAKCRICKKKIPMGEVRIGKLVPFREVHITQYFHLNCSFTSFKKARTVANVITCMDDVDGVELIDDDDRIKLNNMIESTNAERTKPLKEVNPRAKKSSRLQYPSEMGYRPRLSSMKSTSFKIMYTNADQLTPSKRTELVKKIETHKPMIIAVCEVKPKTSSEYSRQDYEIPNYTLHPLNLDTNIGRGIALYSHASIDRSVIQVKPEVTCNEVCMLELRLRGGDSLLLGCCYRSPTKTERSAENNSNLNDFLRWVSERKHSHKCIMGDFNYGNVNWNSWSTPASENSDEASFLEALRDSFFHQHVEIPTRRRGNDEPSVLDLVLTSEAMQVSNLCHTSPLGKSDHDVLVFDYHAYLDFTKPKEYYQYKNGDYGGMRDDLRNSAWVDEFLASAPLSSVEELWEKMKLKLYDLRDRFVPKATVSLKSWKNGSFPLDEKTREAIMNKDRKHRHWMKAVGLEEREAAKNGYTKARNKANSLLRKAKRLYERGVADDAKKIPKRFWHHARRKLKTKSGIAPLLEDVKDKDSMWYTDEEKAEILQRQFLSVFTGEDSGLLPTLIPRTDTIIENVVLPEDSVHEKLTKLNVNKSLGPDDIHPRMLKELADDMSAPVALLFNKSIQDEELPRQWKEAYVSPIYKKGSKSLPENYRPISLTCILCKILESMIRSVVLTHLLETDLLSKRQFGFINGRSTTLQLLHFLDKCNESIVQGHVVDTIYFDFKKAFDMVPHKRLMGKLESYGIKGKILQWMKAFLIGRNQSVLVNGEKSSPGCVTSGIPQGTVLGPIIFVLYINDILENITSDGFLFADDTKIFRAITSKEDALHLQSDIDSLKFWSETWGMEFNLDKCHVLTLGKFENTKYTHRYQLGGEELEHVFTEKDLGVTIDSGLTFADHISNKTRLANAIVGLIRRSFSHLDTRSFKKLFCAFVRPHLEYAQSVWAPHLQKHIDKIEDVLMRATKLVDGLKKMDYEERLRKCGLTTLLFRRMRGDIIDMWKHFNVYDKDILPASFVHNKRPTRLGKHPYQLYQRRPGDGERGTQSNSYYFRITKLWNDLPASVVGATDINTFKNDLDKEWANHPLMYEYKIGSQSDL